jgi:hypothetical protein
MTAFAARLTAHVLLTAAVFDELITPLVGGAAAAAAAATAVCPKRLALAFGPWLN